jgi:glutaredoxin
MFKNVMARFAPNKPDLKSLDILMFVDPNNELCNTMRQMLINEGQINNVSVVDIMNPANSDIVQQYNAEGKPVPMFVSRRSMIGVVGFKKSAKDLYDSFMGGNDEISDMQITLFSRDGCRFCVRAKALFENEINSNKIRVVDILSSAGANELKQLTGEGSVPVFFSRKSGKFSVGVRDTDTVVTIINGLK